MKTVCFYCADQNPERDKSRGITNYTVSLLENLRKTGRIRISAVASRSSAGVPEGISRVVLPFRTDHVPGRLLADQLHPLIFPGIDSDVWHYPKGFLPFGPQVRAPKVGTIADAILQFYADKYPRDRSSAAYAYWIAMLKNSIARFDLILTISEFSRREIIAFGNRYKIKMPPIVVTYIGVEDSGVTEESETPKQNCVVHLASKQPHKGTRWLLEQWRDLQQGSAALPTLRIIGQCDAASAKLASGLSDVTVTAPTSRAEVERAMKNARALLLPSEIEGFGLPAVEAFLVGTPVAYVKNTAVEEILGSDTPGGFTLEADSFRAALDEVLGMDTACIQRKGAELRERFSWNRCVDRTMAAYEDLLAGRGHT